jgi:hypothetical protein
MVIGTNTVNSEIVDLKTSSSQCSIPDYPIPSKFHI